MCDEAIHIFHFIQKLIVGIFRLISQEFENLHIIVEKIEIKSYLYDQHINRYDFILR